MPGSNARALEKGRTLAADGLIFDLEDAVVPHAKEEARQQIFDAIAEGGYGKREIIVRVNGFDTPWGKDDIALMAKSGADAILLPKVENADTVKEAEAYMNVLNASEDMAIWCMMEAALGILHAEEIAFATPRLGGFVFGSSDLVKDLHASHTRDRLPLVTAMGVSMLAARAAGIAILDGVHLNLSDDEGFEVSCQQGAEFGFDGKTLIHPKTIDVANKAFSPTQDEIDWSKKIIDAHAEAEKVGQGIVVVDGKLVENLHVENAKRLVQMSDMITEMEKDRAEA